MRKALSIIQWLCISVALLGVIIPVLLTWGTEALSLEVASNWLHSVFIRWASLHETSPGGFQRLTLLFLGLPAVFMFGSLGLIAYLWVKFLDRAPSAAEVTKLQGDLERFLIVYDNDYNFIGRLRKLVGRFDAYRFMEFRRLIFQAVFEYCGQNEDGKETFLVMPMPNDEGKALISVVNEEVNEALVENLLHIRACDMAITSKSTQLVKDAAREKERIMTTSRWLLPDCRSLLVCPVCVGSEAKGLIGVYHNKPGAFGADDDQVFLEHMAAILSLAYTIRAREVGA